MSGFVVALLGAESTGKTTLAAALGSALEAEGRDAVVVGEYLREFCAAHGRTPRCDEQQAIADEQTRRIAHAAAAHQFVIADTSALMIAVYSDQVFGDTSLYAAALDAHRACDLTLLTALDLSWQADGLQRDGPHVREPVDAKVRAALQSATLNYSVVHGQGNARLAAALAAVQFAWCRRTKVDGSAVRDETDAAAQTDVDAESGNAGWHWHCERCGDAACERQGLRGFRSGIDRHRPR